MADTDTDTDTDTASTAQIVYSVHVKFPGQAFSVHAGTFTTEEKARDAVTRSTRSMWPPGSVVSVQSHETDTLEPDWCIIFRMTF